MKNINIEFYNKKNNLKEIALNLYNNGGRIYQLIYEETFDAVILKKVKLENNIVISKKIIATDEEFINIIDDLIYFFDETFAPLYYKHHILSNILENKCPIFLLSKKITYNKYGCYLIKKLFIENMYDNIKFIYDEFEYFFQKVNIKKDMSLTNKKNIDILFKFIKQITWCNYNDNKIYYVFNNHKTLIEEGKLNNKESIASNVFYIYIEKWTELIANYNKYIGIIEKYINDK